MIPLMCGEIFCIYFFINVFSVSAKSLLKISVAVGVMCTETEKFVVSLPVFISKAFQLKET